MAIVYAMARDYYPLLLRAIEGLPDRSAGARRRVYEHARSVLVRKMREIDFGLSAGIGELEALDEAIHRAELTASGEDGAEITVPEAPPAALDCDDPLWDRLCRLNSNADVAP
jgi:hypothetical protein